MGTHLLQEDSYVLRAAPSTVAEDVFQNEPRLLRVACRQLARQAHNFARGCVHGSRSNLHVEWRAGNCLTAHLEVQLCTHGCRARDVVHVPLVEVILIAVERL
eukprot:6199037-Pleurochrysis_carterae.AAC.1